MFTSIHLLPQNSPDNWKYRTRWESDEGRQLHDKIMSMIREGAGEHFLERDFEAKRLGFLKSETDLRGFQISNENINFPRGENFQAIIFSFAEFEYSKFINAFFYCKMSFTRFYDCIFENCTFSFNHCYAATFEKVTFINCDFVEEDTFTNCSFSETIFKNTFIPNNIFYDCLFDSRTEFSGFLPKPSHYNIDLQLRDIDKSELYKQISDGYASGGADAIAREYRFLQLQCYTRYNTQKFRDKVAGFVFELISGYGLRPSRVIATMMLYFLLALSVFTSQMGIRDALLLTSGALFTFGAKADTVNTMNILFQVLYIFSSFVGISLTALFVTVLVNVFIGHK
ncbi:MAG: pentapeptide repeat-containing protein [Bacteroidetes bacterium]|nr:pentapeptide repeat-containing protein [Bacteroidota bacterium]